MAWSGQGRELKNQILELAKDSLLVDLLEHLQADFNPISEHDSGK